MTANEKLIAETAIDRRQAQTYEFIHEEVAKLTGISTSEVENTLDHLSHETIIKRCATPARNIAEGPIPPGEITRAWYEKGELWPR